ncbi:rod shape-determining protein MreC [Aggregatibacter actinomycetemcomitans]|uniref:Cell shape-determining protein MreC n=1 Tax=Aggregatibacter actinomycetemcomitans TaxID=714 RepID=A0A142FZG4_AGGAC|nr:rod shape-determining protein MreC [Aggregatibacter actinomycetemcomitans]AEW76727.1 rod shape-determining protein MreC [Aggregatibacter actinomycetemcomitans ANH9381]AFI86640.1 rod shape-determining protein MreC [Aggregatibacter actinomycetemcomitans D7S-1]KYK95987.1 rod shape-determining protein MreC [Aggregatibacter actinomycetemcomitans serotype d str. SA3733]AHN71750.1 not yet annotated [Aggregatibacter actinomycetemcomitans HK1651]AMQ92700.1 rod shape-determining protein MreC [Aggrega
MKPIFGKTPPLGLKLFFAVTASIGLILSDGQTAAMIQTRGFLETAVGGLYYLANTPRTVLDGVSDNLVDTNKLQIENKVLKTQLREKNADLLLLDQLKVENQRLRLLLNSPLRIDEYKKIAEVLTAEMDVYRQQVVINQGQKDGAYVGQPIIDEKGVVGQIISVGENTSRVLLVTDVTHAIPVQVLRNDVRLIASGTGHSDELTLDNVPRSVDIEKGDLLVTSGLGGRFLEGYPVAVVESISRDGQNYFATVTAKPLASIDKLRYVLLLWPTNEDMRKAKSITPEEVRKAVQQRLENQGSEANKVKKAVVPTENNETLNTPTDTPEDPQPETAPDTSGENNAPAPVIPSEQPQREEN